ncbi:MAG: DUF1553 domain-containing protein [Pirellulales bacterium]
MPLHTLLTRSSFKTWFGCHCWLAQQCPARYSTARRASSGTRRRFIAGFETASSLAIGCALALAGRGQILLAGDAPATPVAGAVQFARDIRPILANHCFECHGPDEQAREADLRLDTREGLLGNGDAAASIVVAGRADDSELYRRIASEDADERMPPADSHRPLNAAQIAKLKQWIDEGAVWRDHWAYIPPTRPELPGAVQASAARNPVDRFLLARLEHEGLAPAERADAVTLARRLAFDLTGLPPTPQDVALLSADPSDYAYQSYVERSLASPHFGERMAVYWLDLVRYADSCGYHSDIAVPISPYRDYVIAAFNDNMPFDRFTREQLAGDLLPDATLAQKIATGFNRLNKTTEEGGAQDGEYLAKSAADRVRTTAGVWLAATLGCAECHDHKYDPFTTRDFYSFAAIFADVKERGVYKAANREPTIAVPTPAQQARLDEHVTHIAELESQLATLDDSKTAERDSATAELKKLRDEQQQLERSLVRSMITVATQPREMRILPRGNWLDSSGDVVSAAWPAFFDNLSTVSTADPPSSAATNDSSSSGTAVDADGGQPRVTRLDLANWLTSADNPLTARVAVNRLWKMFFGVGLSKSLDDFGAQGEPPSHPELLDWLAVEFRESGWDVKHMIRLLVTSDAYRRSSVPTAEQLARDPANRLLARQGRWRLEAEFIRDTALLVGGLWNDEIGGPSVFPYQPEGYWEFLNFPKRTWKADGGSEQYRRGLYTHWQRTFLHPSLMAFDAPSREECTAERAVSNTPQAALALLNDPTFVECARSLAVRIVREGGASDAERLAWVWHQATSRRPNDREIEVLAELLAADRRHFDAEPAAAARLATAGAFAWPDDVSATELAAWTGVARAVLNLHETVTRN